MPPDKRSASTSHDSGWRRLRGPQGLLHHADYQLLAWQPEGILDDVLLDEIGEWIYGVETVYPAFNRYVDLSRLSSVAVRTEHVFAFAQRRAAQFPGRTPVRSALFSSDWVGFGIARLYESLMENSLIEVRAFRDRAGAADWLGVPANILMLPADTEPSP